MWAMPARPMRRLADAAEQAWQQQVTPRKLAEEQAALPLPEANRTGAANQGFWATMAGQA
jgi:hypothetical protein